MRERETLFFGYKKKTQKAKEDQQKEKKEQIKRNFRYFLVHIWICERFYVS